MNRTSVSAEAGDEALSPQRALRRLFLMLFLRGRSSRGLKKERAPRSIGQKLGLTLGIYGLVGFSALTFIGAPVFLMSVCLHAITFMFLGMFVASSAGEILFNKDEADILLHRPVSARLMLWTKIRVLLEVSLWLAGALNLVGLFAGIGATNGKWWFPAAHAFSTGLEAMFCTGSVVLVYQLCLRWFGRERLEGLMTMAQVAVSLAAVLSGQLLPQLVFLTGSLTHIGRQSWWLVLVPPAWFAGFDDAVAGSMARGSWILAALGVVTTVGVVWAAFGKLSRDYESGLQRLNEGVSGVGRRRGGRRWIDRAVDAAPLRWWLREPAERASFLLAAAYLLRDRDVKLRVYPAIAPFLVLPILFLVEAWRKSGAEMGAFQTAFAGVYLGLIPLLVLTVLRFSQQWQAADIFRVAPLHGPVRLHHGARRAVLCILAAPIIGAFGIIMWLSLKDGTQLLLLLPGAMMMPLFALLPGFGDDVLLSQPTEEAKSARRGTAMIGAVLVAMTVAGLSAWAWSSGWFWEMLVGETLTVGGLYVLLRLRMEKAVWGAME